VTTYTMSAKDRREAAIGKLLFDWIGQSGEEMGILVKGGECTFQTLYGQVRNLKPLSKTVKWERAVDASLTTIEECVEEFCAFAGIKTNEERQGVWYHDVDYWSFETSKYFTRFIKHAVWQTIYHCANI
jgi:hypothetical protein